MTNKMNLNTNKDEDNNKTINHECGKVDKSETTHTTTKLVRAKFLFSSQWLARFGLKRQKRSTNTHTRARAREKPAYILQIALW